MCSFSYAAAGTKNNSPTLGALQLLLWRAAQGFKSEMNSTAASIAFHQWAASAALLMKLGPKIG